MLSAFSILEIIAYIRGMKTPPEVLKTAKGLVDMYGPHFVLLGERDGQQVYEFVLPEDEKTGFPFLYLYEKGQPSLEVTGFEALEIIRSFGAE